MSRPQPALRHLQQQQQPSGGLQTVVQTHTITAPASGTQTETSTSSSTPQPILRLRGAHTSSGPHVQWAETVVDNEGLGRKSSKVCCIYHAPKAAGESSSESSSDSSDSDTDSDTGPNAPRRVGAGGRRQGHADDHEHGEDCPHVPGGPQRDGRNTSGRRRRRPSPNAYEKQPKPKPRSKDENGGGNSGSGGKSKG